jgi:hypothetical protein
MAKVKSGGSNAAQKVTFKKSSVKKRTSIGNAKASRPKNKHVRRATKAYRGQGRP